MDNRINDTRESLAAELVVFTKLATQPHLSSGARAVIQLQIDDILARYERLTASDSHRDS